MLKKYLKRKVLHYYDTPQKKRSQTKEDDFDGSIRLIKKYSYDSNGRPQRIIINFPKNGQKKVLEYKYKNGKIWQEIEEIDNNKTVKIYIDGRLIRIRTYQDDKIFNIVDYQYVYY